MSRRITIDPITRLEGHGKIHIFYRPPGHVDQTFLQVPDFKGFEKFCEGRPAEEMPTLTQKICGVCPTAHHTTSSKALDELFAVDPPPAAKKIRALMYNAFIFEDHLLHFFFMGGPDFIAGMSGPSARRNVFGLIDHLGGDLGKRALAMRKRVREINGLLSGSPLYPVCGLPGGISKGLNREALTRIRHAAGDAVDFSKLILKVFHERVLSDKMYQTLLHDEVMAPKTYYMGLVDENNRVNFYEGQVRVVDPVGTEYVKFSPKDYETHLEERVEPGTYMKPLYLKKIGWKGLVDGTGSGIYRVGPLARLNVSEGMSTPSAQAEYERMFATLGGKPAHQTMAYHWARLIEVLYAAERMDELSCDEEILDPKVRSLPEACLKRGVGVCEAPRGTLFHHYTADADGIIEQVNFLVATQNNAAAISMSVDKAARAYANGASVSETDLNIVEAAFRAYDPCLACATH
jgi:F420-non-reducing hydrogenase large subunit